MRSRYSGPSTDNKVSQVFRSQYVHIVSQGSGTFRQIADQLDKMIVGRQVQMISKVTRLSGEGVHPCNTSLSLFVGMLNVDKLLRDEGIEESITT